MSPKRGLRPPFNDTRAILAYVGAGRLEHAWWLMNALRGSGRMHAATPPPFAARSLVEERIAASPHSTLNQHLMARCEIRR